VVTSPKGLGTDREYAGEDQQHMHKTHVLSSERTPQKNKTITVKE
jgi:hypothetical protein